jgi:hypothetical protein
MENNPLGGNGISNIKLLIIFSNGISIFSILKYEYNFINIVLYSLINGYNDIKQIHLGTKYFSKFEFFMFELLLLILFLLQLFIIEEIFVSFWDKSLTLILLFLNTGCLLLLLSLLIYIDILLLKLGPYVILLIVLILSLKTNNPLLLLSK